MTQPIKLKAVVVLKRAIADERRDAKQRVERYEALTKKTKYYHRGSGPACTSAKIDQARRNVENSVVSKVL